MKKILFAALLLASVMPAAAQETYENVKVAAEDLNGSARYVGMGGAMEARQALSSPPTPVDASSRLSTSASTTTRAVTSTISSPLPTACQELPKTSSPMSRQRMICSLNLMSTVMPTGTRPTSPATSWITSMPIT